MWHLAHLQVSGPQTLSLLNKVELTTLQVQFLFNTHELLRLASSLNVSQLSGFFFSPQVDEITITALFLCLATPQPFISCFLHFLPIIIMKFTKLLEWIEPHQRPFAVQRCWSIEWCDVSISPVPQFRGLSSHHFSGGLQNGAGTEASPLPDLCCWPLHREEKAGWGLEGTDRGAVTGFTRALLLFSFCR